MTEKAFTARSGRGRLTPAAAIAVLLIPVLAAAILIAGLAAPSTHLARVTAAVVNNDTPVTINGTSVPLGRQFAAGLIGGALEPADTAVPASDTPPRNLTWVLTNGQDAADGLESGQYAAVLTIPPTFSADATSMTGTASQARQGRVDLQISPSAAFIDPTVTAAITQAATAVMNRQLTTNYLSQVYDGFNTIHDQVGQASSGADSLATSTSSLASGAASLASGTAALSSGAASLSSGGASLSTGAASLSAGASSLSRGLALLRESASSLPTQTKDLARGASAVASATGRAADGVAAATTSFAAVVKTVCLLPGPGRACDDAKAALKKLRKAETASRALTAGATAVATGNEKLAEAMPAVVGGIDSAAAGAGKTATGAAQTAIGAAEAAAGAARLAASAEQVDAGAVDVSSGAAQVDDGTQKLATGLDQAVQQIPTYSKTDSATLSTVAAQPVAVLSAPLLSGAQSVPLFIVIALWLGGMVLALVRRAVPTDRLLTATPSWPLALRSLGMGAALGALQGLLVSPLALAGTDLPAPQRLAFAVFCAVIGAVFAVVNQGLAAAFGAAGRIVALVVALVGLATGLTGTIPHALATVSAIVPTSPALAVLRAAFVGNAPGAVAGVAGCPLFGVVGMMLVVADVVSRRTVRFRNVADTDIAGTDAEPRRTRMATVTH